MSKPTRVSRISEFLSVIAERQTYKNLLYLVVAFPLAVGYYVLLSVGFMLGIGLSILGVGLGILAATVIGLRYIAAFERWLANRLLDTKIPTPSDVEDVGGGIMQTVKVSLHAPSTWRGFGFILLKFLLETLLFILLVSFLGTTLELLLLPVFPGGTFHVQILGWKGAQSFETATQRISAVPIDAVLVFGSLYILNAFAKANATSAVSLLGSEAPATENSNLSTGIRNQCGSDSTLVEWKFLASIGQEYNLSAGTMQAINAASDACVSVQRKATNEPASSGVGGCQG